MGKHLAFISPHHIDAYTTQCPIDWATVYHSLRSKQTFSAEDFEHYVLASSLYSSKIEGNTLDVNSFFRNRSKAHSPKKREVTEIEHLADAYKFASENNLTKANFLASHALLAQTLVPKSECGKVRKVQVGVRDAATLRPIYMAVEPEHVQAELTKLFADINVLLKRELSHKEVFYYASMLHLWVALIHPFTDGNGRCARLLEKWFLVKKLGSAAWSIQSELYYWHNRPLYYTNIALGFNYYALHWERCIPFLLMLPQALKESI